MSSREWFFRINDILKAIKYIQEYTVDYDLKQFEADQKTIDAAIRNLEILGEAACHIPENVTIDYPDIPWRYMRDMRNLLIHEYFGVHPAIIWETIQKDLPPLKLKLQKIKNDQ